MKNVIYVDDEPVNLMIFSYMFKNDFNIKTFESPIEALEYISNNPLDVICSDQLMPLMTGVELFEKVTSLYPNKQPLRVLITGFGHNQEIQKAIDKGYFDKFIRKPWEYDSLKNIICQ